MKKKKSLIAIYIIIISLFFILFLNLYSNFFHIVSESWFANWQSDSEGLIIKSLNKARQYGITYNYGLMGDYVQQIGLQGIFLRILDRLTNVPELPAFLFKGIFVAIFCVLVFYFIYWAWKEFGPTAGVFLYLGVFFNSWLIVSSRNLYWVTFTLLLPFVCVLILCRKDEIEEGTQLYKKFFLIPFVTIFIRAACGFEMISTVMIAMEVPIVYYAFKNHWNNSKFLKRFFYAAAGALSAFVAAFSVNFFQQILYFSSLREAIENIVYTISKRTGAFNISVDAVYAASLEATKLDVLHQYFTEGEPLIGNFHMASISIIFLLATLCCFMDKTYSPSIDKNRRKLQALSVATWISFLAPLSWYILATPHSYIHTVINYILWSFPFLLLGCVLCGSIISAILFDWIQQIKKVMMALIFVIIILSGYFYTDFCKTGEKYLEIVSQQGILITQNTYADLYYYADNLYYLIDAGHQKKRFFLHFYPDDTTEKTINEYGFVNRDFDFKGHELSTYCWGKTKIARVPLNENYRIDKVNTGQYDETGREWDCEYKLRDFVELPEKITPYNLTDNNWLNGISNDGTRILLEPNDIAINFLKNKSVKTLSGENIRVLDVEKNGNWFHVILEKRIDAAEGYPNTLEIVD